MANETMFAVFKTAIILLLIVMISWLIRQAAKGPDDQHDE